jgi:hypothetical protein
MQYMGINSEGKPTGWDSKPWGTAIEVSDEVKAIHQLHPEYVWDGTTLSAPVVPKVVVPATESLGMQTSLRAQTSGTFQSADGKVITVVNGFITSIEDNLL